jgi:hypothetical protein
LEVVGIGLIAETRHQEDIWLRIKESGGRKIVSDDPKDYHDNMDNLSRVSSQRSAAGLEWGLKPFVEGWPVPDVEIDEYYKNPKDRKESLEIDYVANRRPAAGLHWHESVKAGHIFSDIPDDALEKAFQFFDVNPDAPALLLYTVTGGSRSIPRKPTDRTETVVCLILAKRERIDWLRGFATYAKQPEPEAGGIIRYPEFLGWKSTPPVEFKPTKFIPKPWVPRMVEKFDRLPNLAIVHRPVIVAYGQDADGKPTYDPAQVKSTLNDNAKLAAFKAGWAKTLQQVPPGTKMARVFYEHGDASHGRAVVPFTRALTEANSSFDIANPKQAFNLHTLLGETGHAAPLALWSVASMAAYAENDVNVTLSLRDPLKAVITVLTPDTSAENMARRKGGNPLNIPLR